MKDKTILDAGCGNGYLSRKLVLKGAKVIGIDYSSKMIQLANKMSEKIKIEQGNLNFIVDSATELSSISEESVDFIVSNYVLMDLSNYEDAFKSFYRVLKTQGEAVIVINHPCFHQSDDTKLMNDMTVNYKWNFPYFDQKEIIDPPWNHFKSDFTWYHRPLADYFKVIFSTGFSIVGFFEPIMQEPYSESMENRKTLEDRMRPVSVIFHIKKG